MGTARGGGQVTHSTFALGLARILDMVFWMFSYKELTSHAGSNSVGMFVLFAQFVHIAIMGDFFYYYAIRSGRPPLWRHGWEGGRKGDGGRVVVARALVAVARWKNYPFLLVVVRLAYQGL